MIDLADLDSDLRSAGILDEDDRIAFMVLAKHVNGALGAPPKPASLSRTGTGERITDARLGRIAEAGERCVADGIDVMLDDISQRGLGELARELLDARTLIGKLDGGVSRVTAALGFAPGGADFDDMVDSIDRLRRAPKSAVLSPTEVEQLRQWRALLEEDRYAGVAERTEIELTGYRLLDRVLASYGVPPSK